MIGVKGRGSRVKGQMSTLKVQRHELQSRDREEGKEVSLGSQVGRLRTARISVRYLHLIQVIHGPYTYRLGYHTKR